MKKSEKIEVTQAAQIAGAVEGAFWGEVAEQLDRIEEENRPKVEERLTNAS